MGDNRELTKTELDYVEAQAEREAAERVKVEAETRGELAKAEIEELKLEREREKREHERAANEHHRVYVFDSEVGSASVKKCMDQLTTWARQEPGCAIEIQINSPGGSIFDGFALIDFIHILRQQGHHITMVGLGCVASMAAVILQTADVRVMGENAFVLIHEGSLGAIGDFGDVEDRVSLMRQMHERILTLFEERAKPINAKTTKTFIRNRWKRRDWWLSGEECLRLGLVDQVR